MTSKRIKQEQIKVTLPSDLHARLQKKLCTNIPPKSIEVLKSP